MQVRHCGENGFDISLTSSAESIGVLWDWKGVWVAQILICGLIAEGGV